MYIYYFLICTYYVLIPLLMQFLFPVQSVAHPKCMPSPLLWWSYPNESGFERSANGRIWNELEAKMAATYYYWLYSEGFNPWQIAILSPYRAQVSRHLHIQFCLLIMQLNVCTNTFMYVYSSRWIKSRENYATVVKWMNLFNPPFSQWMNFR